MLIRSVLTKEFHIGEQYRSIATAAVALFSIGYALSFLGLLQYVAYLGPGLGDDLNFSPFIDVANTVFNFSGQRITHPIWLAFVGLCTVNVLFTAGIIFAGYYVYPKTMGKPFPLTLLFTYFSLNAVCTVGIFTIHLLQGLTAPLFGFDFMTGLLAFDNLLKTLKAWAMQVPTVLDLPAWLAFFVLQMVGGFFHYWFHRLAHESRLLWLLFHRSHHMTPELIQPSTQAVFNAFPFFLFAAVPYVVIFSFIGKLITAESLVMYLVFYKIFSAFANLWSHQTALYSWAQGQWWIRVLSTITSEGVYHYLHHSAEASHNQKRGNLINIGGGLCFIWDRVFGTYVPVSGHRPRVGLQNMATEAMTTNPIRLALAGIGQILFELNHNRDLKSWAMILCGPSSYMPKNTKDYVLKAQYGNG